MLEHALTDAFLELVNAEFAGFEELLDQRLIGFGDGLHQGVPPFGHLIGHVGRHLGFFDVGAEIVLIDVGLVGNEIDDAAQLTLSTDRKLDRYSVGLEAILDLAVNLEEVRTGAVHLVHEHHPGNRIAIGLTPDGFRLGLNATNGAEDGDHTIQHTHGALHLNGEVHVARRVDDVDPMVLPGRRNGSCGDRDATLPFLGHPVGHGGAVMHLADFVNHTGIEQDPFCRGGFAGIDVSSDTNISDAFQGEVAGHRKFSGGGA